MDKNNDIFADNLAEKTKKFTAKTSETLKQTSFGIVGAVLILAIIMLNFVQVDFNPFLQIRAFATNTVLLILCTYWFSINFGDYGMQTGYSSDKYKTALNNHLELKNKIQSDKSILVLDKFCNEWTASKLVQDRQNELREVGMDYDDYIANGYNKLTDDEIKKLNISELEKIAITNANAVCLTVLESDKLLNMKRKKSKSKNKTESATGDIPTQQINPIRGKTLIRIVLNSIFAGGIVISTAITGGLAAWALCIFKIALMIVFAFKGYLKHYSIIADEMTDYLNTLSEYLKQFVKWNETNIEPIQPESM